MYKNRKPLLRVCPDCQKSEPWHKPSTKVCDDCVKLRRAIKRPKQYNAHVSDWKYYCSQLRQSVSCLKCKEVVRYGSCNMCDRGAPRCSCYYPIKNYKTGKVRSHCHECSDVAYKKHKQIYGAQYQRALYYRLGDFTLDDLDSLIREKWYQYIRLEADYIPKHYISRRKSHLRQKLNYRWYNCGHKGRLHSTSRTLCHDCSLKIRQAKRRRIKERQYRQRQQELIRLHNNAMPCIDGQYLYIMTDGNYYKVGISKNPRDRMRYLQRKQGATNLSLLGVYQVFTSRAIDTERVIHKQLSPFNLSYQYPSGVTSLEWFDIPLSLLLSCVEFHAISIDVSF